MTTTSNPAISTGANFMHPDSRIYVAGHRGLVGSAIHRELLRRGYHNILTRTHEQLDLCDEVAVNAFFSGEEPDFVFLAAAKVGGIFANNTYPADFIRCSIRKRALRLKSACWSNGRITRRAGRRSASLTTSSKPAGMRWWTLCVSS